MIDRITRLLVQPALECYKVGSVPRWQNAAKTCHVFASLVSAEGAGPVNVVTFEGTTDFAEWLEDFNPLEETNLLEPQIGPVHGPSLANVREVGPGIFGWLKGLGWPPYYVVGHSKGAREAPLLHAMFKFMGHAPLATRLFEPPRVGGVKLARYLATDDVGGTQTFNCHGSDIVTLVPDGPEWDDCVPLARVKVPDYFDIAAKHRMPGVAWGVEHG